MKFKHQDIIVNKFNIFNSTVVLYNFYYIIENNKKKNLYKIKEFKFNPKTSEKVLGRTFNYNADYIDLDYTIIASNKPIKEFKNICEQYIENLIFQ